MLRAQTMQDRPPLKVEKVKEILGYDSTGAAYYALLRMLELGLVVYKENGEKGEWYLA